MGRLWLFLRHALALAHASRGGKCKRRVPYPECNGGRPQAGLHKRTGVPEAVFACWGGEARKIRVPLVARQGRSPSGGLASLALRAAHGLNCFQATPCIKTSVADELPCPPLLYERLLAMLNRKARKYWNRRLKDCAWNYVFRLRDVGGGRLRNPRRLSLARPRPREAKTERHPHR
jgi:hypothetical protein